MRAIELLSFGVMAAGAGVFVWLFFVSAPYGRHARPGWGPTLASRTGWMLMESPSALGFLGVFLLGRHAGEPVPLLFAALWLGHYLHRAFIYPLRMRAGKKEMPLAIVGMAVGFNCVNAWINARWISELGDYPLSWLRSPAFIAGVLAFAFGLWLNLGSDAILRGLRKPGEDAYRVPHGGGFRYVSAPNYLGELTEWAGWALATWSLPGLAFALFTAANLVPRALANHRWYQAQFQDYPKERRALVPFLW